MKHFDKDDKTLVELTFDADESGTVMFCNGPGTMDRAANEATLKEPN